MSSIFAHAKWQFEVCNACRYCEQYCAVFPAMERRVKFAESDMLYLANLCHDCRDCYVACPFIPPHEFKIDIPATCRELRAETYGRFSWPNRSGMLFSKLNRVRTLAVLSILGTLIMALPVLLTNPTRLFVPSHFYEVIPQVYLRTGGLFLGFIVISVLTLGVLRFWRVIHGDFRDLLDVRAIGAAFLEAVGHRWFRGGGTGCSYPQERQSYTRMFLHMLVMFGFASAFASTVLAYIHEDFLGIPPPYPIGGPIVITGTVGGMAIVAGVSLMGYLKRRFDRTSSVLYLDYTLMILLGLVSVTGLATLLLRDGALMGTAFIAHMGFVLVLFVVAPYGKVVHATYRFSALVKNSVETLRERNHPN